MKPKRIVFCDFDGTITANETFVSMLKEFAPDSSAQLLPLIYNRQLTLKAGVRQMLESIPSHCYQQIIDRTASQRIRLGLKEFLEFLNSLNIPFVVISGGLTDMVKAVLQHQLLMTQVTAIYAAEIDSSSEYLRVYSDLENDIELVAKVQAMAKYSATETIAIGDSVTDINMALQADLVFARDRLIEYLEAEKKPYIRWHNFLDVRDYLAACWN